MLTSVNNQKDDGAGNAGEGQMPINFFDLLYERLVKEVELMMQITANLMQI
jgi:hypothetical protein